MEDNIYKAMPILNTLGINVNQYAPDNNALQFGKALLGIATDVYAQKKESEFNSKVAQINQLELDFKNKTLVNKDIDLQDPEKRATIFKTANDLTEAQKKIILDYKHLDNEDIQKLEGILIKNTGERAFNLQNDTNKIMIKQETDHRIDETLGAIDHIEQADIKSVVDTSYQMVHNNVKALKKLGMQEQVIASTVYTNIIKAEGYRENKELENQLMGKDIKYSEILNKFEARKKEIINDEYLDEKVDTMLFYFSGTSEEKERARAYFKDNLKVEYEKTFASKREWVMQQYETQKERELNQQRFLMQYELDKENLAYQKEKDVKDLVRGYVDSGDLIGAISAAKGIPVTPANLLTSSTGLFKLGTNMDMSTAVARNKTADIISNEKLKFLETGKQNSYDTGQGIGGFIKGYIQNEVDSIPSKDGKILYSRNLSHRGLVPYGLMEMYINNNPEYGKATNLMTFVETQKGKANNFLDLAQSGNNKFKSDMTTLELDTQQQQFLSDYISAKAQSNQLPKGVLIPNDSNFTRNSINFYATNDEFQRDVLNTAKLIKKFYTYPKFEVLPISGDMIDQAGAKARQEASKESAYIDYSDKSRTNPGSVKTTGGNGKNNGTGKNQFQKTTTKDGKKIKFINGLR